MTNEIIEDGLVANVDSAPQPDVVSPAQDTIAPTPEKFLSQSHVDSLITDAKRRGYERGRQESGVSQQGSQQQGSQQQGTQNAPAVNLQNKIDESVKAKFEEASNSQRQLAEKSRIEGVANHALGDFQSKADEYKKLNSSFDDKAVMGTVTSIAPYSFVASSQLVNSPEVWDYLVKDKPTDIQAIESLMNPRGDNLTPQQLAESQKLAMAQLQKISERLKENKNAKNMTSSPAPIGQIETDVKDGVGGREPDSVEDFLHIYTG